MKKFTRILMAVIVILLSANVLWAQLKVEGPGPVKVPEATRGFYDVLYQQMDLQGNGWTSQDFSASFPTYTARGADDFIVPAGETWNIMSITAPGSNQGTAFDLVHVYFYNDLGGYPDETEFASFLNTACVDNSGTLEIDLTPAGGISLAPGHYWFTVQAASDYSSYGQWFWSRNSVVYNDIAHWRNPGNGFGNGAITFTDVLTVFGESNDFSFVLNGTSGAPLSCDYQVSLMDDYGDGWNGGALTVTVAGVDVLTGITLPSGSGPLYFTFNVTGGDEITTTYSAGSWAYENYYDIIDSEGNVVYTDGAGGVQPSGIGPGLLYASCPEIPGVVEGYVFNYDGLTIAGATVGVENGPSTTTGNNGFYSLDMVPVGDQNMFATKTGFNVTIIVVAVPSNDTVQQDFILTQPNMVVNPLSVSETLNPEEYFTFNMSVLNNGNGLLGWTADIVYPPPSDNVLPTVQEILAMNNITPVEATGDPTGKAPFISQNHLNLPEIIVGRDVDSDAWGYAAYPGNNPCHFVLNNPGVITNIGGAASNFIAGADFVGDDYYGCVYGGTWVWMEDPDPTTGVVQVIGSCPDFAGVAYDISESVMYGVTFSGQLYTVDYETGTSTMVGTGLNGMIAMACSNDGILYAIDLYSDNFGTIDKATGAWTAIGPVGMNVNYAQDMAWDHSDDVCYWAAYTLTFNTGQLYTIDHTTGTPTLIGNFQGGEEVTGFGIPGGGGAGNWLTMDYYEGTVPAFGGVDNIPTHMDASGTTAGEVYTADIVFDSDPYVGTITVPVEMIILGDPLVPPDNLEVELIDDITGEVLLTWEHNSDAFQYFLIRRDGTILGTTTNTSYTDILPDYGNYCYTVQAVYDEGQTAPAGPECIEWPNPTLLVFPEDLEGWVWVDHQVTVFTTISNTGIGTLSYTFPAFAEGSDETRAYCSASGGCDEYISNVTLESINNTTVCDGYYHFTTPNPTMMGGASYTITVTIGNPWSIDIVGVWIDYDQNEEFDEDMITMSGSPYTSFSGTIEPPTDAATGPTRMRVRMQYGGTLAPCGSTSYGEVEDYTVFIVGGFIVDVQPAEGLVPAGGSQQIAVTYDAAGFPVGDYTQELMLECNDPTTPEFIIDNTMHVYQPAQYAGYVYDNDNSGPLPGVTVTAGAFQTMTAEDGTYELYVDEGSYDVHFEKLGYQTYIEADTFAAMGIVTPLDVGMWDMNYPPTFVHAEVMDSDTWCEVTWALPAGPYEIQYDDGTAEDFALWQLPGSQSAVKFTPSGYPCTVIGGRLYVGDGSFPGPFLGTEFGIAIYDDDGTDGLPGTMLDSGGVTVNNFGWVEFDWFSASFTEGDFYISMIQVVPAPNAAPIGIDMDNPTYYRSYSNFQGQGWTLSAYQDFMMRAWVDGPEGDFVMTDGVEKKIPAKPYGFHQVAMSLTGIPPITLPGVEKAGQYKAVEGVASRDVTGYGVARYSDFDPNFSPELGTLTPLATTGNVYYNDMAWAGLAQGWYAYGVRAHYTSGEWSEYAVSNVVGHLMEVKVTVNVTLSTGLEPINVEVVMQGLEYPYQNYTDVTPASGTIAFDPVWKGCYSVTAYKIGYELYRIDHLCFFGDYVINIVLSEKKYPVTNLYVDPLTLIATWNKPLITAVSEDFEVDLFPPPGWQMTALGIGWYRTDDGSSANWPVPTWDSYYAISNDDAAGTVTGSDGSMDYLITPQLDMRESDGYAMYFDSYYDGAFGQLAFVEYSYDAGATWEVLYQMPASTAWSAIELDLATFSGPTAQAAIWFAFHSDDAGEWASGWCVDNVRVQVPDPAANYIDFHVFLDGAFVASTDTNTYNYAPLTYGVEYEASVAARYTSGLSAKDYYVFLCKWLIPPRNLIGAAPDDAALLKWDPPLEGGTLTLISEEPRQEFPNPVTEYSPMVRTIENNSTGTRDPWDLQFSFATADNSGEAGAESDGDYLYTTQWNGSGFHKYELDGTYVGPMSVAGIGSIRDLAYDPTTLHMFGGAASTTVYEMDFATQTQIGTFNAPVAVRAIAYDPDWDGFWANNWSDNITLFDKTGAQLNSFPVGSYGSYYGFAHDMWTVDGPYLWGFSQDGGNTIVQIEIATGLETGETHDVNGILFIGTGIAGGLFTHPNLVSGFVTIGGNSQNDTYFGYELAVSGPQPGLVPDNLLGYNMYRDEGFVFYQDHVGGLFPEQQFGVEEGLDPGIYAYTVTGVYDLTKYGLPGETGESMEEGPAIVVVDFCFELEFMEDWDQGSFENNNWTEQSNWSINGQVGNPAPAAEFTWDPIQTEYELSLTSYPLCASGMSEGNIWLDFDLKHESYNHTGEEFLLVQVWNWDNDDWFTVLTYSNLDGSFDWMSVQKDIKAYAMGKVFKIRFQAQGMNSLDILSWYVDNIHVYRTCAAPTELTAEEFGPDYDDIKLTWVPPAGGLIDEWFHYDDGVNFTAIGTGAAAEFDCAARWEPAQLVEYAGTAVTEIAFFPAEALCEYHVRVWVGAGAANMVVDQVVASPLIGQWNYITLDTPVPIDITQDLWVGYYVNTQTGYPAGCDAGPAIDGFGNMMNFGGWQTLLQINPDLDYNWNIQARVVSVSGDVTQLSPIAVDEYENAAGMEFTLNANYTPVQPVFAPTTGSRLLTGFNIYRSDDGMPYDLLDYVEDLGVYEYIDEDLTAGVIYCYKVTAIFTSDLPDMCESDFSNEACDYVTVGVDELGISSFAMYPNPAVDYVAIESSDELKRVTVYNTLGQLIMDEIVSGNKYELSTSSYTVGSYMVRVETEKGVSTSVLTVQR